MFNTYGTESTLSSLSSKIHLTASSTASGSQKYEGSYPNESSYKAVKLTAPFVSKDFEKCRIIRILYTDNNSIPQVHILDEFELSSSVTEITYTDKGESFMAEITIEEFNNLTGYQFFANSLEVMSNMLFASNVIEDTWDPGWWDARAYRCNNQGEIKLDSANGTSLILKDFTYDTLITVPKDHDCINPSNAVDYKTSTMTDGSDYYVYRKDENEIPRLGGKGANVSYEFITAEIPLVNLKDNTNASINVAAKQFSNMKLNRIGKLGSYYNTALTDNATTLRTPNYADPAIASMFTGYQRDEVYRFGIIFYNKKHIPSPVYWIADIRMPHAEQVPTFSDADVEQYTGVILGINFNVKNIPNGAISYDIVRCDRTEQDRTVVMQCCVTNLLDYFIQEQDKPVGQGFVKESIEMRPLPFLSSYSDLPYLLNLTGETESTYINDSVHYYKRLISPEISLSKKDIISYLNENCYLDYAYTLRSKGLSEPGKIFTYPTNVLQSDGKNKTILEGQTGILDTRVKGTDGYGDAEGLLLFDGKLRNSSGTLEEDFTPYLGVIASYFSYPVFSEDHLCQGRHVYNIMDAKYSEDIPYNSYTSGVSAYKINVGERTYTNYAMSYFGKSYDDKYI